jgi:hypothetical protein
MTEGDIVEGEIVEGEIVHVPGNRVQLGMIEMPPEDVVKRGAEIATVLKDIILRQGLYTMVRGKAHVHAEGWATLGAMIGVLPKERPELTHHDAGLDGWEAYVDLIRVSDGMVVGGAGALCTRTEDTWKDRDEYAIRSMAVTRATGKAYRLAFAWVMKLAGYDVLPEEEAEGELRLASSRDPDGPNGDVEAREDFPAPPPEPKKRAKPKPKADRKENQWEENIVALAVDLGFANHAKNAVAVLNRSPLGKKYSYPDLPAAVAIAWFVCWDQIKTVYGDKSTDQREKLCKEAWKSDKNQKEYEAIARQAMGEELINE